MKSVLKKIRYGQPGFTFLELLVASVILGALLSVVFLR
jgi:prepilin-type N-terminal cleavage/methylation domain-containing protein